MGRAGEAAGLRAGLNVACRAVLGPRQGVCAPRDAGSSSAVCVRAVRREPAWPGSAGGHGGDRGAGSGQLVVRPPLLRGARADVSQPSSAGPRSAFAAKACAARPAVVLAAGPSHERAAMGQWRVSGWLIDARRDGHTQQSPHWCRGDLDCQFKTASGSAFWSSWSLQARQAAGASPTAAYCRARRGGTVKVQT